MFGDVGQIKLRSKLVINAKALSGLIESSCAQDPLIEVSFVHLVPIYCCLLFRFLGSAIIIKYILRAFAAQTILSAMVILGVVGT